MKQLVLCLALAFSCIAAFDNTDDFINEINSRQTFWTAGRNFHEDTSAHQFSNLVGSRRLPQSVLDTFTFIEHHINDTTEIPESFDARTQWPNCQTIGEVSDQSACRSDWAISVASAISDRICIHSNGKLQPHVSAKHLLTCCMTIGCEGGPTYFAWEYWRFEGLVTGGRYGSNIGCQPYPFAQCSHFAQGHKPECPSKYVKTPKCITQCDNTTIDFAKDLSYGESTYRIRLNETQIQLEIMKNGPVIAGLDVYEDFLHYKSGIYVKTSDSYLGYHSARVIGWGVENSTKYWLVINSWNDDWGDMGLFKIRRGTNECFFEADINAGLPK